MAFDRVNVALFGLGRAGTIHLGNLVANCRINLSYLIEADLKKANTCVRKYNLTNTTVLSDTDDGTVYKDER